MYCGLIDILCRYFSVKMKEKTVTMSFALTDIVLVTCWIYEGCSESNAFYLFPWKLQ